MTVRTPVWDARWEVVSGIGRFSREVRTRLGVASLDAGGARPTSVRGLADLERAALRERSRSTPRVLVSPGFMAPLRWPAPTVVVVHDLMHRDVPGEAGPARRAFLDTVVRRSVRSAAVVLTVSEHSRRRILDWAGLPDERVVRVGNGVGAAFTAEGPARDEGRPYLLYVGNHRPHKNLPRMVEAFAALDAEVLLVVSGERTPELEDLVTRHGVADRLRTLGALDDAGLAAAYRGAAATLVLSTHEGFGLPALEAMASGSPVVASPVTSLPEVLGTAAVYADPGDVGAMTAAMTRVLDDRGLAARLSEAGRTRAREFTWERVSTRVAAALDPCLGTTIASGMDSDEGRPGGTSPA